MSEEEGLLEALSLDNRLASFSDALQISSVIGKIDTKTPYTVFAPTNDAFREALAALNLNAADLINDQALLDLILGYHVVTEAFLIDNFVGEKELNTLAEGQGPLVAKLIGQAVEIVGAGSSGTVLDTLFVGKVVIHIIDSVLVPVLP
eukprot:TRINITY_DN697_c0_g1_i1.p4 TRINITY_DN697_c0_g1~~TRINITY_DN697_c0_g1_i1.p4  ORF type:complete len:148 (+),score=22.16 TRINITY_DN697_c0_g1_i1:225-668(+)